MDGPLPTPKGWRWWKTEDGVIGNSGRKLIDVAVTCTSPCAPGTVWGSRVAANCTSEFEWLAVYGLSCHDALATLRSLPQHLPGVTWVSHGWQWWVYPNGEAATLVGLSGAKYIRAGL